MPAVWTAASPGPPPQFLYAKRLHFHGQRLPSLGHSACLVSCLSYGFLRVLTPLLFLEVGSACSSLEPQHRGGVWGLLLNALCKTRGLSWAAKVSPRPRSLVPLHPIHFAALVYLTPPALVS